MLVPFRKKSKNKREAKLVKVVGRWKYRVYQLKGRKNEDTD